MKYTVSAAKNEGKGEKSGRWLQYLVISSASLAALGSGLHFSWPSPSIPKLLAPNSTYDMTPEETSYLAMLPPLGYLVGAPSSAFLVDRIGRKVTNLLIAVPHLVSWVIIASTKSSWLILFGRFVAGIGDGALLTVLPMYLGEVSEPEIRGVLGSSLSVSFYLGIVLINGYGSYVALDVAACISMAIPLIFMATFAWVPETPYYYLMKGRVEDARMALTTLRRKLNVDDELSMLAADVRRQISESGTFKDLFLIDSNRKAFLVLLGLRTVQVFGGLAAFNAYTQMIFEQAGGDVSAGVSSIIFATAQMIVTLIASVMADRLGRRPLVLFSTCGTTLVLFAEGTYFCLQHVGVDLASYTILPLIGMVFYVIFFCAGLGMAPNLMAGELFSATVKAKALSLTTVYFAIIIAASTKIFHYLEGGFGMHVPFYAFGAICALGVAFAWRFVPETKGRTLEEIQQVLKGNKDAGDKR